MDICFATSDSVNGVWQEKLWRVGKQDLIVFGFNGLGLVSYKKELGGDTEYFQDLAKFSRQTSATVISGCDTNTYGVFRHSAVIADKGKILGVTDMIHTVGDSEYAPSGNFKVYDSSAGKIGIIIAEDLFFPETATVLSRYDADFIVCLFRELNGTIPQVILRACAFSNGITMSLCAKNYAAVSDMRGNISVAGSSDIIKAKIKTEKEYHTVCMQKRGLFTEIGEY